MNTHTTASVAHPVISKRAEDSDLQDGDGIGSDAKVASCYKVFKKADLASFLEAITEESLKLPLRTVWNKTKRPWQETGMLEDRNGSAAPRGKLEATVFALHNAIYNGLDPSVIKY